MTAALMPVPAANAPKRFRFSGEAKQLTSGSGIGNARDWIRLVETGDLTALNKLIAQGLNTGALQPVRLSMTQNLPDAGDPHPVLSPFCERLSKSVSKDAEHHNASLLMLSWEAADKSGLLPKVLREMGTEDGSSGTLRRLFGSMKALSKCCLHGFGSIDQLRLSEANPELEAPAGISRLKLYCSTSLDLERGLIENIRETGVFAEEREDGYAQLSRSRPHPRLYLEMMTVVEHNDGSQEMWTEGAVFISDEAASMDAFAAQRHSLQSWETMAEAARNNPDRIDSMVKDGYPVDAPAEHRDGERALSVACGLPNDQTIERLLLLGAHPGRLPREARGPIFGLINSASAWATNPIDGQDFDDCLRPLMAAGLDINEPELLRGETPLMKACKTGRLWVVTSLVAAGADVDARDLNGLNVFDQARKHEDRKMDMTSPDICSYLDSIRARRAIEDLEGLMNMSAPAR